MAHEEPLFGTVKFFIDTGIAEPTRDELRDELLAQGGHSAMRVFDATHVITNTLDFEDHHEFDQGKTVQVTVGYFLPVRTRETELTNLQATLGEALRRTSEAARDKYNTAMHHKDKMGLEVLIPAWFQDCVQLQQRLPTGPYSFPNPARYKPLASLDPIGAVNHPAESIDSKLKSVSSTTEKHILFRTVSEAEGKQQKPEKFRYANVWQTRIVLLGKDLNLQDNLLKAVEASIERNGGFPCHDEDKIEDVDVYVCRHRAGETFQRAVTRDITIGTVAWVFHCEQVGRLTRPMDQLCHFPIPIHKIKDFDKYEITVTNYTGDARDYLKNLIDAVGAKFSATMSKANTHVIAAHLGGQKAERAMHWNIPIVNHTWLEDCFLEWKNIPIGGVVGSKYNKFPTGINFMSLLGERGFVGFHDTDPRKILGEPTDVASSSVSNGKHAKRPRLEQVATGSGENTPQARQPAGEISTSSGPSRPPPSAKSNQEHAPVSESGGPSRGLRGPDVNGKTPTYKRASNAADNTPPRRPGRGETPTPKGVKPLSASKKKPAPLPPPDAMDLDTLPDLGNPFENPDDPDDQSGAVPEAGPSNTKLASKHRRPVSEDDDLERIQKAGLAPFPKPQSKQSTKTNKPPSKSKHAADATDGPSSSRRVGKAASNPTFSGTVPDDPPSPRGLQQPLPPELAGLKRSETDPNLLILTTDDENNKPTPTKKKSPKKRKATKAAPAEVVSSVQSSRGASVSETESAMTDPISAVPGRLKRGAAARAEAQLRDHIMPDVLRHEKDLKSSQGDVRKLHIAEAPSSSRKRGRIREAESDGEESDDDRPSSRRRKVDGPAPSKPSAKTSKGKGKARAVDDDDEEIESTRSTSNAPTSKPRKKAFVIDIDDDDDMSDSASGTVKKKGKMPWIMTTSYDLPPKDEAKLIKMGAKKAEDISKCTHLVAGKGILRTVKFVAAVARGVQVVTPEWIKASLKANAFVDPGPYLPKDSAGEKKYGFKLGEALERAREKRLFKGHKFWITKSLDSDDLSTVIEACGGEATTEQVKVRYLQGGQSDKRHVVSCKEDSSQWSSLPNLKIPVYGKDFIYNSALRQIADWNDAQVWNPAANPTAS
ncbi:hypothetical protein FRC04_005845 [Tulasnella sp. 424]|nr:hypothetical protein FRC04_005845 [Tulasnella sp. 424]KAG8975990.1 hypothetical protein FRC05_004620 [Tulasnella sp. 425]